VYGHLITSLTNFHLALLNTIWNKRHRKDKKTSIYCYVSIHDWRSKAITSSLELPFRNLLRELKSTGNQMEEVRKPWSEEALKLKLLHLACITQVHFSTRGPKLEWQIVAWYAEAASSRPTPLYRQPRDLVQGPLVTKDILQHPSVPLLQWLFYGRYTIHVLMWPAEEWFTDDLSGSRVPHIPRLISRVVYHKERHTTAFVMASWI
jgi:hypothetical protein